MSRAKELERRALEKILSLFLFPVTRVTFWHQLDFPCELSVSEACWRKYITTQATQRRALSSYKAYYEKYKGTYPDPETVTCFFIDVKSIARFQFQISDCGRCWQVRHLRSSASCRMHKSAPTSDAALFLDLEILAILSGSTFEILNLTSESIDGHVVSNITGASRDPL